MRTPALRHLYASLLLLPLSACDPGESEALEDRITALEDSLATLTEAIGASVDLRPGDGTYEVLRIHAGSLVLTLDSIVAAGTGSRISLRLGNLTSAEIDEVVGFVGWGVPEADGSHVVTERRSRQFTFDQVFAPGAWTAVTFVLDSVPPAAIGFLRFSDARATGIRLQ